MRMREEMKKESNSFQRRSQLYPLSNFDEASIAKDCFDFENVHKQ
jgi:hypothetical protein